MATVSSATRPATTAKRSYALDKVTIHHLPEGERRSARRGERGADASADAVTIARDLINTPRPMTCIPSRFAELLQEPREREQGQAGLTCTVLRSQADQRQGHETCIDAVGRGSARGPRLIHLKYEPAGYKRKPGKKRLRRNSFSSARASPFDTGGICLKPAPGMDEMKGDMGGAANVAALMAAVAESSAATLRFTVIIGTRREHARRQQLPSRRHLHRRTTASTVEIINTDAEGRLALADVLALRHRARARHHPRQRHPHGRLRGGAGADGERLLHSRPTIRARRTHDEPPPRRAGRGDVAHAARRRSARKAQERLGRLASTWATAGAARSPLRCSCSEFIGDDAVDPRPTSPARRWRTSRSTSTRRAAPATVCSPTWLSSTRSRLQRGSKGSHRRA